MTYKAGDKVWYDNIVRTVMGHNDNTDGDMYWLDGFSLVSQDSIRPATPVEIAKQAVLDEVSSIANNSTELVSNLIDQLISDVKIQTNREALSALMQAHSENVTTPPIIGDETKLS